MIGQFHTQAERIFGEELAVPMNSGWVGLRVRLGQQFGLVQQASWTDGYEISWSPHITLISIFIKIKRRINNNNKYLEKVVKL